MSDNVVTRVGSVASITIPMPPPPNAKAPPTDPQGTHQAAGGVTIRDASALTRRVEVTGPSIQSEGLLGSAVDAAGKPTNVINDKTKYVIKGPEGSSFTISAANAVLQGWLIKNQDGTYSEPKADASSAEQASGDKEAETEPTGPDPLAMPPLLPEEDRIEEGLVNLIRDGGMDPLQIAAQVLTSDFKLSNDLTNLAKNNGITPEVLVANMRTLHDAHAGRIEDFMRARSVDPADVWLFESTARTRGQQAAGRINTLQGSTQYWERLISDYRNIKGK